MLEFFCDKDVTVVTNAVAHAQRLAKAGVKVRLVGGELKSYGEENRNRTMPEKICIM